MSFFNILITWNRFFLLISFSLPSSCCCCRNELTSEYSILLTRSCYPHPQLTFMPHCLGVAGVDLSACSGHSSRVIKPLDVFRLLRASSPPQTLSFYFLIDFFIFLIVSSRKHCVIQLNAVCASYTGISRFLFPVRLVFQSLGILQLNSSLLTFLEAACCGECFSGWQRIWAKGKLSVRNLGK